MASGSTRFILKQLENTMKGFDRKSAAHIRAYETALRDEANDIMAMSQYEVPVRHGFLKNSKFIKEARTDKRKDIRIILGYSANYAVYVHDRDLNYTHGKWRYLIDPLIYASKDFLGRMARRIKASGAV